MKRKRIKRRRIMMLMRHTMSNEIGSKRRVLCQGALEIEIGDKDPIESTLEVQIPVTFGKIII